MALQKQITIQSGSNIGQAIIDSFPNYNQIEIVTLNVAKDTVNKVNIAVIVYSLFKS